MKLYVNLAILAIFSFHSFSQTEVSSQKSVYYPVDSLINSKKAYCYKVYQNFYYLGNLYQVYWAIIEDNDTFLYQESYNDNFQSDQLWKVKISCHGIKLMEQIQKNNNEKSEILRSDLIPWKTGNKLHYVWTIKNTEKKLKRTRRSAAITDSIDFQKVKHLTYIFTDKIIIKEYNPVGKANKRKLTRTSYHLEGVGLYKSIQKYPEVFITFELEKILDYDVWVKTNEKM